MDNTSKQYKPTTKDLPELLRFIFQNGHEKHEKLLSVLSRLDEKLDRIEKQQGDILIAISARDSDHKVC